MGLVGIAKGIIGFAADITKSWFVGGHRSNLDAERMKAQAADSNRVRLESQEFQIAQANRQRENRNDEIALQYHYQQKLSNSVPIIPPGKWVESVCPHDADPLIIFDTFLRQDHAGQQHLPFNPLTFLAQTFKEQNREVGSLITGLTAELALKSEADARLFYNEELPNRSTVLVYGEFLGNRLMIHGVYGGMTNEQLILSSDGTTTIVPRLPHHVVLGEFPQSLYDELLAIAAKSDQDTPVSVLSQKHRENMELLYDFAVNTKLQILVDHHFGYRPDIPYTTRAGSLLEHKAGRLASLGMWSDELKETLADHGRRFLEFRNEFKTARTRPRIGVSQRERRDPFKLRD